MNYRIIDSSEGVDEFGARNAHVAVEDGVLYANHYSVQRGGCLNAGFALFRNWRTGASREVDLTSWARASDLHCRYLLELAAKHVG